MVVRIEVPNHQDISIDHQFESFATVSSFLEFFRITIGPFKVSELAPHVVRRILVRNAGVGACVEKSKQIYTRECSEEWRGISTL